MSWNPGDDLPACLASIEAQRDAGSVELLVVDNASEDGTPERVRRDFPAARVIEAGANLGFAAGCNLGLRAAAARVVLLLNPDAELRPGALAELLRVLEAEPRAAVVGPRTLNADGTPQLSWGPALSPLAEWRQRRRVRGVRARDPQLLAEVDAESRRAAEPDWVSGACLLARREALVEVGDFDTGYFMYEEDVDLCLRLRAAGWRVLFHPGAEVVHRLGRSAEQAPARARLEYHRSHLRYYARHRGALERLLLRAAVLLEGVAGWLRAGDRAERGAARDVVRTALGRVPGLEPNALRR